MSTHKRQHIEALRKSGLGLIAERIAAHNYDIDQFCSKELVVQSTADGTMAGELYSLLGELGHTQAEIDQRLLAFWEAPAPRNLPTPKTPVITGIGRNRINQEGRRDHRGHMVFTMNELSSIGEVLATVPAQGLLCDADGVPVAVYRNGRQRYFGHMPLEYRMAECGGQHNV